MSTVTVSPELAKLLRSALLSELGEPVEKLADASLAAEKEKHPEWFLEPLAALDGLRAVLEAIGWGEPERQEPVNLDLDVLGAAVAKALKTQLEVEHDYAKREQDDPAGEGVAVRNAGLIEQFLASHRLSDTA